MRIKDAAAFWGVDRATIYRWIKKGRLTYQRDPGGRIFNIAMKKDRIDEILEAFSKLRSASPAQKKRKT